MNEKNIEILTDITEAWNTLNPELIIKHLSPKFIYDSQWSYNSLDYQGYIDYIRGKFETIRKTSSSVKAEMGSNGTGQLLIRLNQGGNIVYYRIAIENDKVIKGDLCMF
ncbi:MAG: hypothetical protein NC111_05390 [Bacteroides sp.]|nr:hypothetical protein [Bacteroides sp.]MCM1413372.1 hypothetical protein [Bacteroides sp.]MCM1471942.1 hypothetical protein [Bacteroides sp.]